MSRRPGTSSRPAAAAEDPAEVPFTLAAKDRAGATVFVCPLCGARFTHGLLACGSCPLHRGCEIVKCPACGYGFPRTSRLVDWALRLVGIRRGGS